MKNFFYWLWRVVFRPPHRKGAAVVVLCPPNAPHWRWMYPGPLSVVKGEYVPLGLNIPAGYLYVVKHRRPSSGPWDFGLVTIHEKWLASPTVGPSFLS